MINPETAAGVGGPPPLLPLGHEALRRQGHKSSTVHALDALDRAIATIRGSDVASGGPLVDLGCSYGTLAAYVAGELGLAQAYGVDRDAKRLEYAAELGIRTLHADLEADLPLALEDGSASIVTSFGALEHVRWYDGVLEEARRLLMPGGWLLLSMPNLGSYVNRLALLLGYQPRDVEVSKRSTPGVLPIYADRHRHLGHLHSATLRCVEELVENAGFVVERRHGYSPGERRWPDVLFGRIPSLSRRFMLLARATKN